MSYRLNWRRAGTAAYDPNLSIKGCDPVVTAGHRLPIDDAGLRAQARERLDDQGETVGQVIARPAVELHPLAVLAGDHPEAVVLDFMQPQPTGRRVRG